jgi:hypothetical protein
VPLESRPSDSARAPRSSLARFVKVEQLYSQIEPFEGSSRFTVFLIAVNPNAGHLEIQHIDFLELTLRVSSWKGDPP